MTLDPLLSRFVGWLAVLLATGFAGTGIASVLLCRHRPALARELVLRYAAWVAMAALVVATLAAGRAVWCAFVLLVALAGFREYARAVGVAAWPLGAAAALAIVAVHAGAWLDTPYELGEWLAAGVVGVVAVPVLRDAPGRVATDVTRAIFGVLYVGGLLSYLARLFDRPDGVGLVLFVVVLASVNDVAAFVCGRLLGRHPLRPAVSPAKTWEGALGGVLAAASLGWALRWLLPSLDGPQVVLHAIVIAVASLAGDLVLAAFKRDAGLKDWGTALPGHGGVLDRVNGLILAAPAAFALNAWALR